MPKDSIHGYLTVGILMFLLFASSFLYAYSPLVERTAKAVSVVPETEKAPPYPYEKDHVVVFLDDMRIELRNGTTTLASMDIVSKGKPGSYYETIGGSYENDYKIRNHFSSIGKVYLPYAVHVFGNFFIHGIPYYPDGNKVSSEYSGGCIRLADEDAKRVYTFVSTGVPMVVVQDDMSEFYPTERTEDTFSSMETTRYMATIVSLEVLKQDEKIQDLDSTYTTRRRLIPRLLNDKDDSVIGQLSEGVGEKVFLDYMNKKAAAIGLTNTTFVSINGAATTTEQDYFRLRRYVSDYKSYLVSVATTTTLLSQ
jgi:hypothetical protein